MRFNRLPAPLRNSGSWILQFLLSHLHVIPWGLDFKGTKGDQIHSHIFLKEFKACCILSVQSVFFFCSHDVCKPFPGDDRGDDTFCDRLSKGKHKPKRVFIGGIECANKKLLPKTCACCLIQSIFQVKPSFYHPNLILDIPWAWQWDSFM